jgi:hypothetical protein
MLKKNRDRMSVSRPFMSRSIRRRIYSVAGLLALVLWLFMAAAEACPGLHAWLHGGAIPDDDDCAIVAVQHGKVDNSAVVVAPVVIIGIAITLVPVFASPSVIFLLSPDGRGPPAERPAIA